MRSCVRSRGPLVWLGCLLAAALLVAAAATDSSDVDLAKLEECAPYFGETDDSPCSGRGDYDQSWEECPEECRDYLLSLPERCKDFIESYLPKRLTDVLNDKCGVDFHGQGEEDDYPSDMSTDYPPEFPTEDPNGENGGDPCQAWVESEEAMTNAEACAAITDPQGDCPEGCQAYIEAIPSECVDWVAQWWDPEAVDLMAQVCGAPWASTGPTPDPDVSPSPDSDVPSPGPAWGSKSYGFDCDGDFSWVELDPDHASQWGELEWAEDAGPYKAVSNNCSSVTDGCCSETAADQFPWWQYEFPTNMTVRGIRVVPTQDLECCADEECTSKIPCIDRLASTYIMVGGFNLPEYYKTSDYAALLDMAGGDASLAQNSVMIAIQEASLRCNMIFTDKLSNSNGQPVPYHDIGCGLGDLGDANVKEPTGQYVTLWLPAFEPKSLALCGIQICAKRSSTASAEA